MIPHLAGGPYILVVDDDADDQFLLRRAIGQVIPQALVESVYDGSEAMACLERGGPLPDLVFLDLNMVKISGKATMEMIRASSTYRSIPVVILTTSKNADERDELLAMGANAFYTKPFNGEDLVRIVKEVKEKQLMLHA